MKNTISLFKVMVAQKSGMNLTHAMHGFVTDFTPSPAQLKVLKEIHKPLPITTLFSVEERKHASLEQLLTKQILHYIEVYGLESPGLFNLEVSEGQIAVVSYIRAVTPGELTQLVHELIYANRPIADIKPVLEVIQEYGIQYNLGSIQNNEVRVALFNPSKDTFQSGDDAVRWICYKATDSALLIKSKKVEAAIKEKPALDWFLARHQKPLAEVFNRHKRLIMACKNPETRSTINRISKLSKTNHVPFHEPISKRFVAEALARKVPYSALDSITLRDKFKYLNLIEYKLLGLSYDTFHVRNGKVWFELDRKIQTPRDLYELRDNVLASIQDDLSHLRGSSILIDPNVDYGLPISRKQTVGNLPFGTRVTGNKGEKLSAGIYWHDSWWKDAPKGYYGSQTIDLDLSSIDDKGARVGWGGRAGYTSNQVTFSGDVTAAPNGATEFFVVNPANKNRYGLMVNVFRGPDVCPVEIVVGHPTDKVWQDQTFIREKTVLGAKQSLVGFLKDDAFVVYSGSLNESRVSGGKHPIIDKGLGTVWTIRMVLDEIGVKYDLVPRADHTYQHDLRYMSFTIDKLETMLGI